MKLKRITITICEPCLNGEGSECRSPGCALYLHRVDLPIDPMLYGVQEEMEVGEDGLLIVEQPGLPPALGNGGEHG